MTSITKLTSELEQNLGDTTLHFIALPDQGQIIITDISFNPDDYGNEFNDPELMQDVTNIHLILSNNNSDFHIYGRIIGDPVNESITKTDNVTEAVQNVLKKKGVNL